MVLAFYILRLGEEEGRRQSRRKEGNEGSQGEGKGGGVWRVRKRHVGEVVRKKKGGRAASRRDLRNKGSTVKGKGRGENVIRLGHAA